MEFCPTTTNGFPLNVIGEIDENATGFADLHDTADTYISFGNYSLPRKLTTRTELDPQRWKKCFMEESTQTSLTSNGLSYVIKSVQFCAATHPGSSWPRKPAATNRVDMIMTFSRPDIGTSDPSVYLIVVPIYMLSEISASRSNSAIAEEFFKIVVDNTKNPASVVVNTPKYPSLQPIFFDLGNQAAVKYVTCIQLRPPQPKPNVWTMKYLNMAVLYFPAGWIIKDQNILKGLSGNNDLIFSPYILPGEARGPNYLTPRIEPVKEGSTTDEINKYVSDTNNWSIYGELRGNSISLTDIQFKSRFRWIKDGFAASKAPKRLKSTFEYQCLPLDKAKDIDGTNVLLDPATGTRTLASELDGTSSEENKKVLGEATAAGKATRTFAIVLGSIFGVLTLFIGLSYVLSYFTSRSDSKVGQDIIIKAAAAIGSTAIVGAAPTPKPVTAAPPVTATPSVTAAPPVTAAVSKLTEPVPSTSASSDSQQQQQQISRAERFKKQQADAIKQQPSAAKNPQPQTDAIKQQPSAAKNPQPQGWKKKFGKKRGGDEEEATTPSKAFDLD